MRGWHRFHARLTRCYGDHPGGCDRRPGPFRAAHSRTQPHTAAHSRSRLVHHAPVTSTHSRPAHLRLALLACVIQAGRSVSRTLSPCAAARRSTVTTVTRGPMLRYPLTS